MYTLKTNNSKLSKLTGMNKTGDGSRENAQEPRMQSMSLAAAMHKLEGQSHPIDAQEERLLDPSESVLDLISGWEQDSKSNSRSSTFGSSRHANKTVVKFVFKGWCFCIVPTSYAHIHK